MGTLKQFLIIVMLLSTTPFIHAQKSNVMANTKFSVEEQKVMDAITNMTSAFHKKDIEGVMASYTSDALVVFEPQTPITDKKQLRQMFEQTFMINPKFVYSGHEVFITGNYAMHLTPWTMTATAPDGSIISSSGLSVAILQKQVDGRWLMIFDNPHGQFLMNPTSKINPNH